MGDPFKADTVALSWDSAGCTEPGAEWLEVALSGIRVDNQVFEQQRYFFSASDAAGVNLSLDSNYLSYRLRATARYADICNLRVQVLNGTDVVPLPARVTITGTAELANVRQSLSVSLPQQTPQASVFDFVLFSQQSICKDIDPSECL